MNLSKRSKLSLCQFLTFVNGGENMYRRAAA